MPEVVRVARVTAAVLGLLTATDVEIGDGEKPAAGGWQGAPGASQYLQYAVLWPIPGGSIDGSLGAPDSDAEALYQVTSVGATRAQAEITADICRAALIGAEPSIEGRNVIRIRSDGLGAAQPDRSVEPAVWMVADRFAVTTDS